MQQARQDALRKTPHASSLQKYVEASPERHAFMTEVARIAVHRNWSQEKLAAEYRTATGASEKFGGGNVDGHFNRKGARPPRPEVRAGYATALGMSEEYVRLLMEPGVPHKSGLKIGGKLFGLDSVTHDLSSELAEPLFEDGALADAIHFMRAHPNVFDACIHAAQLADARFKLMPESPYIPKLSLDKETFLAAGIDKRLWVKWSAVAETLSRHKFDLASRVRHKDARLIRREELLSIIFSHLYDALGDFDAKEYRAGIVKFAPLGWNEWLAVEHLLKLIFSDRRWPVSKMLGRLHSDNGWVDFADNNDPDQQAWREEQEHDPDFQAARRAAHEASCAE